MATHILTFDKDITTINSGAFANQTKLTSISFPDGITLENNAFQDCINLESVNIPANVTIIGKPFNGCTKLVNAPEAVPTHDYIEIGGVKWATMNVGASSVTDLGLFFRWGETQGYTSTQVEEATIPGYRYMDENDNYTKYNDTDEKTVLDLSDDAVNAAWCGNWRMPTKSEFESLAESVDFEHVTNYQGSGVDGWLVTDKTDSSKVLFFPYVPNLYGDNTGNSSSQLYWSNTLLYGNLAFGAICYEGGLILSKYDWSYDRTYFNVVRGVLDD